VAFGAPDAGPPTSSVQPTSRVQPTDALAGAWVLGAPEVLLPVSAVSAEADRAEVLRLSEETASAELHTMVLCRATRPAGVGTWFGGADPVMLPGNLEPVALLTFREKVRDDARATMEYFRAQDVDLKVISGDHPRTVAAV